jgi:antirestriction protein
MAQLNAYSIYDKKLGTYGFPFHSKSDPIAIAEIGEVMEEHNDAVIFTNAEDFSIYCVGTFDDHSSLFESSQRFVLEMSIIKQTIKKTDGEK